PEVTTAAGGVGAVEPPPAQQKALDDLEAQKADLLIHDTPEHPDVRAVERKIADLKKQIADAPAPVHSNSPTAPRPGESAAVQKARMDLRGIALALQSKQKEQDSIQQQIRTYEARI